MQTPSTPTQATATLTLIEQVQARREELTRGLTAEAMGPSTRADIENALASLAPMLTGDLAKLPDMVSRDLIRWLESSKYLGIHADAAAADVAAPMAKVEDGERVASNPAMVVPPITASPA